jgi:superfamily II DNA or RNA helicase
MLGLTATPEDRKERQDGTYKIIQWHIGPVLDAAEVDGYTVDDIPFQGRVRMVKYRGHPDYTETLINERLEIVSNSKMIAQLAQDPYRIKLVVRLTQEVISEAGINLFIFANRRSYLEDIHARLVEIHGTAPLFFTNAVEEAAIMTIMGNSTHDAVAAAEAHSRIILTTYQYFGVGKSIPRMNAMILATPFRTGSKQYIGRIFRLGSDYSIVRNIIDIVDWDTTLKSQWYSRKKYYAEKEYPINTEQVSWDEFQEEDPANIAANIVAGTR